MSIFFSVICLLGAASILSSVMSNVLTGAVIFFSGLIAFLLLSASTKETFRALFELVSRFEVVPKEVVKSPLQSKISQ